MAVADVKERTADRDTQADRQKKEANKYQRLLKKKKEIISVLANTQHSILS